ncbi:hypothetical protein O181_018629 [Austropuccinia psidii MF-1]|uniref:dolichol kinase n=1 Tax=Austropuccinia psidii MF-1 TaxID=1389203 RepID=A0A9Q3GTY2_9BASI|nr:hypothetical protein [Austropuccinia psidii MF-1]
MKKNKIISTIDHQNFSSKNLSSSSSSSSFPKHQSINNTKDIHHHHYHQNHPNSLSESKNRIKNSNSKHSFAGYLASASSAQNTDSENDDQDDSSIDQDHNINQNFSNFSNLNSFNSFGFYKTPSYHQPLASNNDNLNQNSSNDSNNINNNNNPLSSIFVSSFSQLNRFNPIQSTLTYHSSNPIFNQSLISNSKQIIPNSISPNFQTSTYSKPDHHHLNNHSYLNWSIRPQIWLNSLRHNLINSSSTSNSTLTSNDHQFKQSQNISSTQTKSSQPPLNHSQSSIKTTAFKPNIGLTFRSIKSDIQPNHSSSMSITPSASHSKSNQINPTSRRSTTPNQHHRHLSHGRSSTNSSSNHSHKSAVVAESILIFIPLSLAIFRLFQINTILTSRLLPFSSLYVICLILITITFWRHRSEARSRSSIYFMISFTDQRGYRDRSEADDGLSLAIGLPLIVCLAVLWSTFDQPQLTHWHSTHLVKFWNQSPILSNSILPPSFSNSDFLVNLSEARVDLLCFTIINLISMIIDLCLSFLASQLSCLPINNKTRLLGSITKSFILAFSLTISLKFGLLGSAMSQNISAFECLFSSFFFQILLYLTSRLARRGFTLAESSIFSSTGVAFMLEIIRLTSARARYSSYIKQTLKGNHPLSKLDPLTLLPRLFRFPTPAIAIQHVLVSGIFLIGFTLAPLLIWSRQLGQRPTKRSRSTIRNPTPKPPTENNQRIQPVWSNDTTQSNYYQPFSNPDATHDSRQYETASKERMRKIIALSIYASIVWIGLVVLSHWLGWLFQIGRHQDGFKTSWWRRVLGPGWLWFFRHCFLKPSSHQGSLKSLEWKRVGILIYWIVCMMIAFGGWTTYLVRKRRVRVFGGLKRKLMNGTSVGIPINGAISSVVGMRKPLTTISDRSHPKAIEKNVSSQEEPPPEHHAKRHKNSTSLVAKFDNLMNNGSYVLNGTNDCGVTVGAPNSVNTNSNGVGNLGEGERKLKKELNLRRKFFHGLACLMFIPAISSDVEFCSISFTVAFVLFTFSEFARYFALYPIGAAIHVFFNEFIDSKDSGPVILSHFYLLTACASGVWLDGIMKYAEVKDQTGLKGIGRIEDMTGVLVLGVGDSIASIVGKKYGRMKYNQSNKTVEGSIGFVISVISVAILLRMAGLVDKFSILKYSAGMFLTGLLEAYTNQNDNLVLSLYSWAVLKLLSV